MYRRGLEKADICKDTINILIENETQLGAAPSGATSKESDAASLSSILSNLISLRKAQDGA